MAKVSLSTIKNWFKTGLIPTQQQFWDSWDSFVHKDDNIAIEQVDGVTALINQVNAAVQQASTALQPSDVSASLTETTPGKVADSTAVKLLKDYIDAINGILTSDDTTLDELQEIVTFIKQNKTELDTLGIANIAGLADALASKIDISVLNKETVGSWFEASFTKDYYGGYPFTANNGGAVYTSNYQNKGSFFGAGVLTNAIGTLSGCAWSTRNTLNGAVRYDKEYYYLMFKLNGDMPSRNIVFGVTNGIDANTNAPTSGTWLEISNKTIALKGNVGASMYSSATATLEADGNGLISGGQDNTSNNIYKVLISTNKAAGAINIKVKNLDNSVVLNETISQVGIASTSTTLMNYTLRVLAQAPNGTNYLPAVINGVGFGTELPNNLLDF